MPVRFLKFSFRRLRANGPNGPEENDVLVVIEMVIYICVYLVQPLSNFILDRFFDVGGKIVWRSLYLYVRENYLIW